MTNGNDSAYTDCTVIGEEMVDNVGVQAIRQTTQPLTKRELFAIVVMHGFATADDPGPTVEGVAKYAVKWADALIAELNKDTTL